MSRAQENNTNNVTYATYSNTVPAGYTATSTYTPVVGTTTSNLYTTGQPTAYYTTQQVYNAPVATNASYTTTSNYVTGAQSGYVQGQSAYVQGGQSGYVQGGYGTQKAVAEEIPVESRIEYIPFEKKYVEYEQVEKVYQVPVEVEVIEYEEVVRNQRIPIERTITDYYAVETQVEYIRREIEETVMVEEPVERVYERVQYIPVQTQIVHYPERDNYVPAKTQLRTQYVGVQQGGVVQGSTIQASNVQVQGGKVEGATYQTYTGQSGSRVGGGTYVSGGSGVAVAQSSYQPVTYTTTGPTYSTQQQYTTQQYTSSYPATYQTTGYVTAQGGPTYTSSTGGYVTGGSGVRATGYVTGGSGVRGTTTYVSNGSNIKAQSYDTTTGYY